MKKLPLTRALWTCSEANDGLNDLLTELTKLQQQIPENLEGLLIDVLDEFHAAQKRLQAVEHDLLICLRAQKENQK